MKKLIKTFIALYVMSDDVMKERFPDQTPDNKKTLPPHKKSKHQKRKPWQK